MESIWDGVAPVVRSSAHEDARREAGALVDDYVESLPYRPMVSPAALREEGFSDDTIDGLGELFASFNTGPVETVLPALPLYAAAVDAEGIRRPL
jgi:hypothetical protein